MRATRRNMDAMATTYDTVFVPDDSDGWDEGSATSGDYWQYDLDADLGGVLVIKHLVYVAPDQLGDLINVIDAWQSTQDDPWASEPTTYTCHPAT